MDRFDSYYNGIAYFNILVLETEPKNLPFFEKLGLVKNGCVQRYISNYAINVQFREKFLYEPIFFLGVAEIRTLEYTSKEKKYFILDKNTFIEMLSESEKNFKTKVLKNPRPSDADSIDLLSKNFIFKYSKPKVLKMKDYFDIKDINPDVD